MSTNGRFCCPLCGWMSSCSDHGEIVDRVHAVINKAVESEGRSAHYSGAGFSNMFFKFRGVADKDFDAWVAQKKKAAGLTPATDFASATIPANR